jgi:hypothetical protein
MTYALWYTVWRHYSPDREVSLHPTIAEAAESAAHMRDWDDCAVEIDGLEEIGGGMVDSDHLLALIDEAEEARWERESQRAADAQANPVPRWYPQVLTPKGEWVDLGSFDSRDRADEALMKFAQLPEDRRRIVEPRVGF